MGAYGKYERAEDIPEDERKYYYLWDKFRPIESIAFDEILFNNRYPVKIPRFLHEYHGWWDIWEKERNLSMEEELKKGMVLYDVGAFDGWLACVWSQFVGAENMVLIEPVKEQWPNTKLTWEANGLAMPSATYMGFVGNRRNLNPVVNLGKWPEGPDYSMVLKGIKFKLLSVQGDAENTPILPIDDLAKVVRRPDAITIDVEGAELEVLQSAEQVLVTNKPLVWVSVHPEFIKERFGVDPDDIPRYMEKIGYVGMRLASDHEDHWFFEPR